MLASADRVVASRLTVLETWWVLERARATTAVRSLAQSEIATWDIVEMSRNVCEAAMRRFPREPVRTLDAIHLVTALMLSATVEGLQILSTDKRIVENAELLGLRVASAA